VAGGWVGDAGGAGLEEALLCPVGAGEDFAFERFDYIRIEPVNVGNVLRVLDSAAFEPAS